MPAICQKSGADRDNGARMPECLKSTWEKSAASQVDMWRKSGDNGDDEGAEMLDTRVQWKFD